MDTTAPSAPSDTSAPASRRARSPRHVVAIVLGCVVLLPGLATIAAGGAAALAQAVATDDDGYFRVTLDPISSDGVAVTADEVWSAHVEDDAGTWIADWLDLDLRLRVAGAHRSDDLFVGVARTVDVEAYLGDAARSQVLDVEDDRSATYRQIPGNRSVSPPAGEDFWVESTTGAGEQELTWTARGGRWSIVVMNADGSPAIDADVEIGVRSDAVTPIAVTLLVVGGIATAIAATLMVIGVRGRRTPRGPFAPPELNTATPAPVAAGGAAPVPDQP